MAPLKTWAPFERLTAVDLNAAFAEVAANRLAGAICQPGSGTAVTGGAVTELPASAPSGAGADPLGYWSAGTSRLVVPAGMNGMHLMVATVAAAAGGAKGDIVRITATGYPGPPYLTFVRHPTASMGGTIAALATLPVGQIVYVSVFSETAANLTLTSLNILRLGTLAAFS